MFLFGGVLSTFLSIILVHHQLHHDMQLLNVVNNMQGICFVDHLKIHSYVAASVCCLFTSNTYHVHKFDIGSINIHKLSMPLSPEFKHSFHNTLVQLYVRFSWSGAID